MTLPLVVASSGYLAWSSLVVPALPPAAAVRTAANAGAAAALWRGARSAGFTTRELGVHRCARRAGARWGGAGLAGAAAGYLLALGVPAAREALARSPAGAAPPREVAARLLVHIPLGTVFAEEVAFRGVLLAVARRRLGDHGATAATALVFALWHLRGAVDAGGPVTAILTATGLGGGVLGWLRLRSGSLLAPAGLHLGANGAGLLAAVTARALSRRGRSAHARYRPPSSGPRAVVTGRRPTPPRRR
ncbi:lysostaphin resistance A-like protein [Blastococcus sp. SYSU DS0753]